jgi:hypothetical protein
MGFLLLGHSGHQRAASGLVEPSSGRSGPRFHFFFDRGGPSKNICSRRTRTVNPLNLKLVSLSDE